MKENKKSGSIFLHIFTPFILFAICSGVLLIALIKPADKIKVYMNLAFMDNLKSEPDSDSTGLVIRKNEIIEDYKGDVSETGEVIRPKFGEQFAVLSSEKFEVDIPVYWGSETELFEHGACQSTSSSLSGTDGNAVISGHVDTFFSELGNLEVGDTVSIKTNYGEFVYTVSKLIEFRSSDSKYVIPTDDTRLTLYTCKKDVLGNSDERTGVICSLTESRFYSSAEAEK